MLISTYSNYLREEKKEEIKKKDKKKRLMFFLIKNSLIALTIFFILCFLISKLLSFDPLYLYILVVIACIITFFAFYTFFSFIESFDDKDMAFVCLDESNKLIKTKIREKLNNLINKFKKDV